jgi:hypothetical protein
METNFVQAHGELDMNAEYGPNCAGESALPCHVRTSINGDDSLHIFSLDDIDGEFIVGNVLVTLLTI